MSKNFFVADLHFGHGNIIKYSNRPFLSEREQELQSKGEKFRVSDESIKAMDTHFINNINDTVRENDTLYLPGDFCMPSKYSQYDARYYRDQIRCKNVHLIWGNHDNFSIRPLFSSAMDMREVCINNVNMVICHYAMLVWNKSHHGVLHLYGHSHGGLEAYLDKLFPERRSMDVGIDNIYKLIGEYRPLEFDEIYKRIGHRKGYSIDHHQ
jgi:calcineurin-like phosphoesterase family protein